MSGEDLAAEGRAIALILVAISALNSLSRERVLTAVRSLTESHRRDDEMRLDTQDEEVARLIARFPDPPFGGPTTEFARVSFNICEDETQE